MRLFLRGYRQAIDAARPAGKALGELRIADPHVKQRGACDRQRLEDSLDVGLVPVRVSCAMVCSPRSRRVVPCLGRIMRPPLLLESLTDARTSYKKQHLRNLR